jgi:hypothetical protein
MRAVGTHVISDVDFDTGHGVGIVAVLLSGGKLIVGGPHPEDRVTFTDLDAGVYGFANSNLEVDVSNVLARNLGSDAFQMSVLDNCRVHMSGVETYGASGAYIGWNAGAPSTYLFEHNVIRQQPGSAWAGFEIWEADPDVKSNIVIRDNQISGDGAFLFGPIFALGAQGAVITNNTITGSGPAAMYLGLATRAGAPDVGLTTSLMVKANNVQGWSVDSEPCGSLCQGLPLAPIWLGAETSGITVVGSGNLRTNVFDETDNSDTAKYDGANILVGVNARGAHIGQAIRDAMQRRIEAKKLFMKPY